MRVLIISDASIGGAGAIAEMQAKELVRQGMEMKMLRGEILPNYSERFRNWRMIYNPTGVALAKKEILDFRPDIIHAHNIHNKFSYAVLKIAKKSGAKVFLTAHDTGLFYPDKFFGEANFFHQLRTQRLRFNPFRNFLIKRYVKYVDRVFAVSDALGEALRAHDFENITLHNGVNTSDWIRPIPPAHFPTVFFAGRISGAKGRAVLPEIERCVRESVPDVNFVVVGKDVWTPRDKMPEIYATANVVIVPSVYLDPFPTVVLEAGASGKPVVITDQGGAKEAVIEGKTGFVADPYSPLFANRIIELLQNPDRAKQMGERAREHITHNFSLQTQVSKLIHYYNGAI